MIAAGPVLPVYGAEGVASLVGGEVAMLGQTTIDVKGKGQAKPAGRISGVVAL
jgi:hypothetical protein